VDPRSRRNRGTASDARSRTARLDGATVDVERVRSREPGRPRRCRSPSPRAPGCRRSTPRRVGSPGSASHQLGVDRGSDRRQAVPVGRAQRGPPPGGAGVPCRQHPSRAVAAGAARSITARPPRWWPQLGTDHAARAHAHGEVVPSAAPSVSGRVTMGTEARGAAPGGRPEGRGPPGAPRGLDDRPRLPYFPAVRLRRPYPQRVRPTGANHSRRLKWGEGNGCGAGTRTHTPSRTIV
jgi:hypothetical protein